jgi:uncharacterized Zn-binding protein involved in type VI secretion
MAGIARVGDGISCDPTNNVIASGSPNVFVNGKAAARKGDPTTAHPHGSAATILGGNSKHVYINGIEAAIIGDLDSPHGSGSHVNAVIVGGSSDVKIG